MHAARVLRDVAADRARDLRRGIGSVVETVNCRRLGNREIAHARLHRRRARHRIDRQDASEFGERQHDALRIGQRASRQARAGAARHHGYLCVVTSLQDRNDLRFVLGKQHGGGLRAKQGQAVALVGARVLGGREQRRRRQDRRELRMHRIVEHGSDTRWRPWDTAAHESGRGSNGLFHKAPRRGAAGAPAPCALNGPPGVTHSNGSPVPGYRRYDVRNARRSQDAAYHGHSNRI